MSPEDPPIQPSDLTPPSESLDSNGVGSGRRVSIFEEERRKLKRRLELQELIHEVSSKMRSQWDVESISKVLTESVAELTSFRNAFILILEQDGRTLRGVYAGGHRRTYEIGIRLSKYNVSRIRMDLEDNPVYAKALTDGEIVFHTTKEDIINTLHRVTGLNPGILEIIRRTIRMNLAVTVPLFLGDPATEMTPLGILAASSIKTRIDEEDIQVVRILANQASMALHNAYLIKVLKTQVDSAESSKLRFKSIIDSAHDMIVSYDIEGKVRYTNDAFRNSSVYSSKGELIDASTLDRVLPEDQPILVEAYLELKDSRPVYSLEYRITDDTGEILTHNMNAATVLGEDGAVEETVIFIRDVTLERQRERQIVKRNKELEILNALISNLSSDIGSDEMITRSLTIIAEFTGADMITLISVKEPQEGVLNVVSHLWVPEEYQDFIAKHFPRTPTTNIFDTRDVSLVHDITVLPPEFVKWMDKMGVVSMVIVPVTLRSEVVGFVVAGVKAPLAVDDDDIAILRAVGDQLGIVLEVAKLMESGNALLD
jgi:PAS domain S-box-containing protein